MCFVQVAASQGNCGWPEGLSCPSNLAFGNQLNITTKPHSMVKAQHHSHGAYSVVRSGRHPPLESSGSPYSP
jgi:hypothetical protein